MYNSFSRSLITKYKYSIYRKFIRAINTYGLIAKDDKIAVCISGGKDSFVMALCFKELVQYSDIPFSVTYLAMNPGYSIEELERIKNNAQKLDISLNFFETNIFHISSIQDKNRCYICAKMRRGALYSKAQELGCNKIALGHNFNDVIETSLLNILYSGQVETMLPKLNSEHYKELKLIRPLYLIKEEDILSFEKENNLNFQKNACYILQNKSLCSQSKRQKMKALIKELKEDNNNVDKNIFTALANINLDKVLAYKNKDKNNDDKL